MIAGTIGGGQLEGDVEQIAKHALISGTSGRYYFNLDADPEADGAICGGEAEVLVDANPDQHKMALENMAQSLSKGVGGLICTIVSRETGEGSIIERFWITKEEKQKNPDGISPHIFRSAKAYLSANAGSGFSEIELPSQSDGEKQSLFIESIKPLPHLVIAGAGHVGRALAHLASLSGF